MLTKEQAARADSLRWYHALDFGSHQTRGRFTESRPPNMTLFGVMDLLSGVGLKGLRCLDVGPAHGLISFGLALGGASQVSAINVGSPKKAVQMSLAEEIFDVEIDYHGGVALEEVRTVFSPGDFDLIVCAGVMYHLLNPADVFFRLRPLLRYGGLLIVETAAVLDDEPARLVLNSEREGWPEPTTYFLPNPKMVEGLARLTCLETLATRANSPQRYSLIGRAVQPHEVPDRTTTCIGIHDRGFLDPSFDLDELPGPVPGIEPIAFAGDTGHKQIDIKSFQPNFRPHPIKIDNPLGLEF